MASDSLDWHGDAREERDFAQFDNDNPHIWRLFVAFTFDRIERGFQHYGARDILHRIRWETEVRENSATGWKINNIWSPWYARKFHRAYPQHAGFFRVRRAQADDMREAA